MTISPIFRRSSFLRCLLMTQLLVRQAPSPCSAHDLEVAGPHNTSTMRTGSASRSRRLQALIEADLSDVFSESTGRSRMARDEQRSGANVRRFWRPTASTFLPSATTPPTSFRPPLNPGVQRRGCILSSLGMQPFLRPPPIIVY